MSPPSILLGYPSAPGVCRCGTHYTTDGVVVRVNSLPEPQAEFFRTRQFCSIQCLRAFCLEALEELAALDTRSAQETVVDLHALREGLANTIAAIFGPPV